MLQERFSNTSEIDSSAEMGKCQFRDQWLQKTDELGYKISSWCAKESADSFFCKICVKSLSCSLKGFQAITQHVESKGHRDAAKEKFSPQHLVLSSRIEHSTQGDCSGNGNDLALCYFSLGLRYYGASY